jgi:EAL domain-containing protein (putative c-di-GMP-specific phosphodiesterase class I)/GGDEF domain-containing protein
MNEIIKESPVEEAQELIRLRVENGFLSKRVADLERKLSLQPQSGLPTHFRLELELEETIESMRQRADRKGFSILIIQLGETYNIVRKTLKSSVSEWVLYQMGCRIGALLEPAGRVFHTRENEFVLILPALKGPPLASFVKSLFGSLGEPHIFSGFNVTIKVAMGAAYWPEHGAERSALLHHADIAAGFASEGHLPFVLFKSELLRKAVEKIELQNSIIKAIERPALDKIGEQFVLYFQPKLIAGSVEGRTIHVEKIEAEALIRWKHPTKGLILPSTFVPLAEETGLILPLGKWLIYQTTRQLQSWIRAGKGAIPVSLNLSARQFRSEDITDILVSAISASNLAPGQLTVELTETSLFEDPVATAVILQRFAALGVRLSVDDFGTGYSSLSHLHRFPLDEIKIDRLFVENIDTNRQDRIIVRSLVEIAKGLELTLVAEGVEKPRALDILWKMGCRGFQGFLIAQPLPAEEFAAFCDKLAADKMNFTF